MSKKKSYNQNPVNQNNVVAEIDNPSDSKKGILTNAVDAWNSLSEEDKAKLKENLIDSTKDLLKTHKEQGGKLFGQQIYNYILGILIAGNITWSALSPQPEIVTENQVKDIVIEKMDSIAIGDTSITVIDDNTYSMGPVEARKMYEAEHGK